MAILRRSDLLENARRPLTFQQYREALKKCEDMLRDEGRDWEILDPQGRSYVKVIADRRQLLRGEARWQLDGRIQDRRLKGGDPRRDDRWWGLLGRLIRSNGKAVGNHETKIRRILDNVVSADDTQFPDIAVDSMQRLTSIDYVAHGTATLLLALARPDRLLSLNGASREAYGRLSGMSCSTLGKPQNYRKLLQWLYAQPWYADSPPTDGAFEKIWRFRAALVDAFVYEPT